MSVGEPAGHETIDGPPAKTGGVRHANDPPYVPQVEPIPGPESVRRVPVIRTRETLHRSQGIRPQAWILVHTCGDVHPPAHEGVGGDGQDGHLAPGTPDPAECRVRIPDQARDIPRIRHSAEDQSGQQTGGELRAARHTGIRHAVSGGNRHGS